MIGRGYYSKLKQRDGRYNDKRVHDSNRLAKEDTASSWNDMLVCSKCKLCSRSIRTMSGTIPTPNR